MLIIVEMKKLATLIKTEECDVETNEKIKDTVNETVKLIKKIKNYRLFIGASILILCVCVSIISAGIMIYFCLKSRKNNSLPY